MKLLLAAIVPPPDGGDPLTGLRENAPPVEVPWPDWVWWAIGGGALLLITALILVGVWLARRQLATQPPSPRHIALRELHQLRTSGAGMDAYAFGVAVSDILRTYISQYYSLHATQQTSPEFLASIATSARFSDAERRLLAAFLEQCDLRKYARVQAEDNEALLASAYAFIESATAP
jgi:hypothetical protein